MCTNKIIIIIIIIIIFAIKGTRREQTSANDMSIFSVVFGSAIFGLSLLSLAMVKNPSILSWVQMLIRITTKI